MFKPARSKTGVRLLASLILGLCLLVPVRSQTPSATPSPDGLSFEQIYEIASRDNLQVKAVQRRHAVAEAEIKIAGQRPNPDFTSAYTRAEPRWQPSISQLVELGGKRGRRIDVARNELRLSDLDLEAALRSLRHDLRAAYFNLAFARNNYELGQQIVKQAKELADIARERFEAGDVAQFEVLQANLGVSRTTNELDRLGSAERIARATMNQLLNRDPDAPLDLHDSLFSRLGPVVTQDLISRSLTQNVELRTAEQQIATEQSRLRLARAQRVPDLTVEPGLETLDSGFTHPGFKVQVSVPLPIFNRGGAEISKSSAMLDQLGAERDASRQRIAAEIARAAINVDAARKQVEFYETTLLPDVERVRDLANEAYRIGQSSLLNVIEATRAARDLRREYLQALLDYQTAVAELEQAAGVKM